MQEEDLREPQQALSLPQETEPVSESIPEVSSVPTGLDIVANSPTEEVVAAAPDSDVENVSKEQTTEPEALGDVESEIVVTSENDNVGQAAVEVGVEAETDVEADVEADVEVQSEAQETEVIAPSVEITSDSLPLESIESVQDPSCLAGDMAEPKTLTAERLNEDTMTSGSCTPSRRRASRSPSKSPMRIEESFEAIDALEEALDSLDAVTTFTHQIEVKSPLKKSFPKTTDIPSARTKTPLKAPITTTRISRAPSAAPYSIKPTASSLARATSLRIAPSKDIRNKSTDTGDYLASKRRPISMSFPTPPPPPKGRAPTKATFQLSSNDVVAKLKAQKEDRLKREAEVVVPKQRPLSMPPPPKSTKLPTKANFQLPGSKIAEKLKAQKEERLKREADAPRQNVGRPVSMLPAPPKSTKPLTKATFQLPGAAVSEKLKAQKEERLKRQEEAEAAKKEASLKPRSAAPVRKPSTTLPVRTTPGVSIPPPPPAQPPAQRSSSLASKRSSIALSQSRSTSTSSTNRNSVAIAKSTVPPVDAAVQRIKGREVFNRDKQEKEARERERKDKEDGARKARADAAERGRIASREWAEKQRKKMMMAA